MSRIPQGLLNSAQEILSRARTIGAAHDIDNLQIDRMSKEELDKLVNHRHAVALIPYLVEVANRGEVLDKLEYREPGALRTTFRSRIS